MRARDQSLDLVRGLGALAVMLMHGRGFFLCDLADVQSPGPLTKGLYFVTGLGHEAVVVFFVLSGYFVGGSVLQAIQGAGFSTSRYVLIRLTRLWTVLIPALILTFGVDLLGSHFNPDAYAGTLRQAFMSGPELTCPAAWGPGAFFGNLFFLQTISAPVYGSNGPLWSLANEFWYYVLFPLLACALAPLIRFFTRSCSCRQLPTANCQLPPSASLARGVQRYSTRPNYFTGPSSLVPRLSTTLHSLLLLAAFAAISLLLPRLLVSLGLIWLFGVGVAWIAPKPFAKTLQANSFRLVTGLIILVVLLLAKARPFPAADYVVGAVFAMWCVSLLGPWSRPGWWLTFSTGLSAVSYTLYVVHFPIQFFIASVVFRGKQFQPTAEGLLVFTGVSLIVFLFAILMWWLFERHTDDIRRWISARGARIPNS